MANSLADFLHSYSLRVFDNLPVPQLTVTGEGTAGTTSYEYKATFKTLVGESLPSAVATLATGNATLTGFNKNKLSVLEIPEATTKVRYWKNAWTYFSQTVRESSTGYDSGDYMVLSANSLIRFQCTTAGTSASSDPGSWPTTLGNTKVDGTVVWTAVTNKNDNWVLLGEVDPDPGQLYDTGQATSVATVPTTDTSGRPGVIAILPKPGTMIQRAERIDTMSLFSQMVQDGFDLIHRSGDVISGCSEYQIDGNLWGFTSGKIYFLGRFIDVPAGQVTLTGSGEEKVGITITPLYVTADDDYVWRCGEDEGVAGEYASTGPDVLYFQFAWVKDNDAQVTIKEFVGGVPKTVTLSPERTELDRMLARRTMAVSGSFCVENFPYQVIDHPTDDTKLMLKVGAGYAFPNGFEVKTAASRDIEFDKARDVESVNNSGTDVFNIRGAVNEWNYWEADTVVAVDAIRVPSILNGYRYKCTAVAGDEESGSIEPTWPETPGATVVDNDVTWTCLGDDYDLDTLALTVQIGSGNEHTLTFSADDLTAAQVVSAIEAEFNAYPTSGEPDLVNGVNAESILQLYAANGKSLTLSGTALAQLGWASGTTLPEGTRVYEVNDNFVKTVTDMNYKIEEVVQITHNGTTHKDLLGTNIVSILGASTLSADAHDGKWDYESSVDWVRYGNYISFDGVGGSEPGSGSTYYVKLQRNYNATKGARHLVRVIDAKVVKTGEDLADNLTFTDATSITKVNGGTAVVPTGTPTDVVRILRVNNSPGQSADQYTAYSLNKNSGALTHETSQVDWSEAGTPGTAGAGQPTNSATYYVSYEFWHHYTEGDYVCADSYDDYAEIEMAPNGTWYLRDCIDFRTTGTLPLHGEDPTFDYEFYLARVDKLTLDDAGNFQLLTGAPAVVPPTPSDQAATLSLCVLRIQPYTYSTADVTTVSVEPLRIPQMGIQNIVERVELLEYFMMLNSLEKEVAGTSMNADKVGVFTDALTGLGRCDVSFDRGGVSHTAALDRLNNCLLLPATKDMKIIEVDVPNSTHVRRAGNTIALDYQPVVYIDQPKAGITVNGASDFVVTDYYGHIDLEPMVDVFMDTEQLPALNVDFDNQMMDAYLQLNGGQLNNIVWDSYSYNSPYGADRPGWRPEFSSITEAEWASGRATQTYVHQWASRTRTGLQTTINPGAPKTYDLGNVVKDLSMVGMMRTKNEDGSDFEVQINAYGFLPNVDHACSIGGIVVDLVYDDTPTNASGAAGTHTYSGKTTVRASNDGTFTAKFAMPSGLAIGDLQVRCFYYNDPDISTGTAAFYGAGFMQTQQSTTIGIPTFSVTTSRVTETQTVRGTEPLAQTFTVDGSAYKYISGVKLFFSSKSSTLGYTVQIRDVVNGYPGPYVFSSKHLDASEISTSTDSSVGVTFTFDTVFGFKGGNEYCFVAIPDQANTDYNLYCSELGTVDFLTGQRINTHPHDGVLFHSPNNRTWEPWTKRDLKFQILESNFENDCQIVFSNLTGVEASRLVLKVEEFISPGVNAKWAYSSNGGSTWRAFNPKIDTDLGDIITQIQLRIDVTSIGGNYQIVDKFAGIVLLLHEASANYISKQTYFTDPLNYPNKISMTANVDADGVNGSGVTTVNFYASVDDGVKWFLIPQKEGDTPVAMDDPFYRYTMETPDEATITGATNASPIVVTSAGHGFKDNMMVTIAGVGGNTNANGTWCVTNATANTFELYSNTGVASSGNSAYTTGGTINMAEFSQLRGRVNLATSNNARTPRVMQIGIIGARV